MPVVTGTIRDPDGTLAEGPVTFQLVGTAGRAEPVAYLPGSDQTIQRTSSVALSSGVYSITLPSNDLIIPAGTRWQRTHDRSGAVLLHVTETPSTQREEDILADPPGTLATAALDLHAADTDLHGGGLELAYVEVSSTADFTTSAGPPPTWTVVPGSSMPVTVPDRPYVVRFAAWMLVDNLGAVGSVAVFADGAITGIGSSMDQIIAVQANHAAMINGELRVPNVYHAPSSGSVVTYDVRVSRTGTGNITVVTSDQSIFGRRGLQLAAVTQ